MTVVIPGRDEVASPESITTVWGYGFRACVLAHASRNDDGCIGTALSRYIHLFKKFNGKPPRGQSMAISSPLPDSVI